MAEEFPFPEPPSKKRNDLAIELISGSVGGAAQVIVGQPLDTLKTTAPKGQFNGTLDILRQTVRREGVLALYKAVNSLLFMSYGASRRIISPYPDLTVAQTALAGSMAGAITSILASPVEMFKIRMQGQYGGAGDKRLRTVVADMWRQYGFRNGIMRGYWITVAREIPAYAGFYAGYETVKRHFANQYGADKVPVWALLTAGGCGGLGYWFACYPLDIAKSRIQLRAAPPARGGWLSGGYISREVYAIVHEGGWRALFNGLTPSLIRAVPTAASTFVAFELTRDYFHRHNLL